MSSILINNKKYEGSLLKYLNYWILFIFCSFVGTAYAAESDPPVLNAISVDKSVDTNTNANDNKQLDPASVSIEDAAKNEGEDASAAEPDGSKVEKLKNEEILDAYQSIRREKGFAAAKQYIQTLKDENKIPDNFTFNGVK